MKFDFSYVQLVYEIIEGNKDINKLINTKAYRAIKSHGEKAFGGHDNIIKAITSIQHGNPNKLAKHLLENRERIFNLLNVFKEREAEFNSIIIDNVKNIYPCGDYENITIFLIVGYDAIGYEGNVICSIDFKFTLDDYRELVSILIHELAHVIHSQYCPEINNVSTAKEGIKNTLNLLIQSEGIAIFSAYNYRNLTGIIYNKEGNVGQDYFNSKEKEASLRESYRRTMIYIDEDKDIDTILDEYFTARVDHGLGFIIFENTYKNIGIGAIREMATMKNNEFIKLYL